MKAINLYIESKLPEELRDMSRSYDVKGVNNLLGMIARTHPGKYEEISSILSNVGRAASYRNGDTIGIEDLAPVIDRDAILADMDEEIIQASKKLGKTTPEFRTKREQIWQRYSDMIEKRTMDAAMRSNNPIGLSVASGARGKAPQLKAMLSTPGAYTDYQGRVIPNFARKSFSEGIRPVDFLAGSFGARNSVISTKSATAKGGYLSKLLNQVTSDQVVTSEDCGTTNGIDVDVIDGDIKGRIMVSGVEGIPSGTFMDGHAVSALRKKKRKGSVIVRSPITCQAEYGVCAKCSGSQPGGKLPSIGDHVGMTSAQSIGEPLTQMALNCLVNGTLVRMADFNIKPIEDILPGEFVLGSNTKGETFPVEVTHTWDQGMQPVNKYSYTIPGDVPDIDVGCTENHKILQKNPGIGDKFHIRKSGTSKSLSVPVYTNDADLIRGSRRSIESLGKIQCHDITVDHPDHLFVLANGLIVSNSKHTAGMASAKKDFSGFEVIQQFVQSPEKFPGKASVSEVDGQVQSVRPAPQGGTYVKVSDTEYYVLPGYDVLVKPGERVEQGQQLGEGLVDPKDIIRLKGIGEGRRYYAERLGKILEDSGMPPMPRNVEMLARAAVNHVIVDDPEDDSFYLPDDIIKYNMFQKNYAPRKESKRSKVDAHSKGKWLEQPVLHYTVGTRVSDSMIKRLQDSEISDIYTSDVEPRFKSQMTNLTRANFSSDDWLAKQHTSYLTQNLRDSAIRGEDSDIENNPHFAPRLAIGKNFGRDVRTTGRF